MTIHKGQLNHELAQISKTLQGTIWLLHNCNHDSVGGGYAHHVRDRISESLVKELQDPIAAIARLQSQINNGIDDETRLRACRGGNCPSSLVGAF